MRNFFTEHVRFIRESNTIESQFEKPYLDDDYHKMHLDPKWPQALGGGAISGCTIVRETKPGDEILWEVDTGFLPPFYAVKRDRVLTQICMHCFEVTDCTDFSWDADAEKGHFKAKFFVDDFTNRIQVRSINVPGYGCDGINECSGQFSPTVCQEAGYIDFDIRFWSSLCEEQGFPGPSGGCNESRRVTCDPCGNPVEMVWTTAPSTMERAAAGVDENILLQFSGGLAPFTWTISVTGGTATLAYGTSTAVGANYVNVGDTACGTVHVTVTDFCSQSLSLDIRITNVGVWCLTGTCGDYGSCPATPGSACAGGGSGRYLVVKGALGKYYYIDCWCGLTTQWCSLPPYVCTCETGCTGEFGDYGCTAHFATPSYDKGACYTYKTCTYEWKCAGCA